MNEFIEEYEILCIGCDEIIKLNIYNIARVNLSNKLPINEKLMYDCHNCNKKFFLDSDIEHSKKYYDLLLKSEERQLEILDSLQRNVERHNIPGHEQFIQNLELKKQNININIKESELYEAIDSGADKLEIKKIEDELSKISMPLIG